MLLLINIEKFIKNNHAFLPTMFNTNKLQTLKVDKQSFDFEDDTTHKASVKETIFQYLQTEKALREIGRVVVPQEILKYIQNKELRETLEKEIKEGEKVTIDFGNKDVSFLTRVDLAEAYIDYRVAQHISENETFEINFSDEKSYERLEDRLSKPIGSEYEEKVKLRSDIFSGKDRFSEPDSERKKALEELVKKEGHKKAAIADCNMTEKDIEKAEKYDLLRSILQINGKVERKAYGVFIGQSKEYEKLDPEDQSYINRILFRNLEKARRIKAAQIFFENGITQKDVDKILIDIILGRPTLLSRLGNKELIDYISSLDSLKKELSKSYMEREKQRLEREHIERLSFDNPEYDLKELYEAADYALEKLAPKETGLIPSSIRALMMPESGHLRMKQKRRKRDFFLSESTHPDNFPIDFVEDTLPEEPKSTKGKEETPEESEIKEPKNFFDIFEFKEGKTKKDVWNAYQRLTGSLYGTFRGSYDELHSGCDLYLRLHKDGKLIGILVPLYEKDEKEIEFDFLQPSEEAKLRVFGDYIPHNINRLKIALRNEMDDNSEIKKLMKSNFEDLSPIVETEIYEKAKHRDYTDQFTRLAERLNVSIPLIHRDISEFYGLLDINPNASKEEIKKAFKRKALKFHPDKTQDPKEKIEYHDRFIHFKEARDTLTRLTPSNMGEEYKVCTYVGRISEFLNN